MTISIDATTRPQGVQIAVATSQAGTVPITIWKTVQGEARHPVRGAYQVTGHTGTLVIVDFEVPYGVPILYEADCGGEWAADTPVLVEGEGAWLRDLLYPSKSMAVTLAVHHQSERSTRTALLRASGRRNPVAVTDVREGQVGTSVFITMTSRDRETFLSLADTGDVLCLTGPHSWALGPLYLVLMKVTEARQGEMFRPQRYWSCEWAEVDPPTTPIYGTAALWSTVDNQNWLNTRDETWIDTAYPVSGYFMRAAPTPRWYDR